MWQSYHQASAPPVTMTTSNSHHVETGRDTQVMREKVRSHISDVMLVSLSKGKLTKLNTSVTELVPQFLWKWVGRDSHVLLHNYNAVAHETQSIYFP